MYIKQWLQDDVTKKQCTIIIEEVLDDLKITQQHGSYVKEKCNGWAYNYSTKDSVVDVFKPEEGWLEQEVGYLYQQLLKYKFDDALEARFAQQGRIQDVMREDGTIEKGLDNDAALSVFSILTHLVVNKYVSNV